MRIPAVSLAFWFFVLTGCSHNPYLDASLTRYQGKDKRWIEKELGAPDAKTSRFFGGEKWMYNRIAGGKTSPPLFTCGSAPRPW